jgi:regulator of replication initiation timing
VTGEPPAGLRALREENARLRLENVELLAEVHELRIENHRLKRTLDNWSIGIEDAEADAARAERE